MVYIIQFMQHKLGVFRLREKSRLFHMIPPPRKIPEARPVRSTQLYTIRSILKLLFSQQVSINYLKPITSVPTVSNTILERRLEFLLSPDAM